VAKQTILKRDAAGNVMYDPKGRPLVDRVVSARRSVFVSRHGGRSGPVRVRYLTAEEILQRGT
jgi:hypothetical protein